MPTGGKFGRGVKATGIIEAIQRLGLAGLHEWVTYAFASRLIGEPLQSYGLDAQSLWSRSVAGAIAASSIAERGDVDRGDAYTAGLMHAIGLRVIAWQVAQQNTARRFASAGY